MSSTISQQDVSKIAQLARLGLSDKEIARATKDLAKILDHFSQIQSIDTTSVPTYENATGLTNITRPDQTDDQPLCSIPDLLDAAPDTHHNHIKVPAVFTD